MDRLYNALPYRSQNIRGVKTDMFNRHLDRWLRDIPDTPKIDNYEASVSAETNSITNQKKNKWCPYMCGSNVSKNEGKI